MNGFLLILWKRNTLCEHFFPVRETAMGSHCSDPFNFPSLPTPPAVSSEWIPSINENLSFCSTGQMGEHCRWLLDCWGGSDWGTSRMLTVNSHTRQTYWTTRALHVIITCTGTCKAMPAEGRAPARVPVSSPSQVCSDTQRVCHYASCRGLALCGS